MQLTEDRRRIIDEARSWIGTPFHHQGRLKGVGGDCVGLIIAVGNALGLLPPGYNHTHYSRSPNGFRMRNVCDEQLDRVAEYIPGDILLMRFRKYPQHMGIVVDLPKSLGLVHNYAEVGRCVEHTLDDEWDDMVLQAYRYRGIL